MPRIILFGILIITLGSIGYFYLFGERQESSAVAVQLVPVQEGPFTASALARGKIIALKKESPVSPIAGIVYDAGFKPGQFLPKGTVIASVQLSEPELQKKQQDLEFEQLDLEILTEQLQYQEELLRAKAVSEREVKELRIRKYKTAKRIQALREDLERKPIKTSVAGILVEKRFHNRDRVAMGSVLCTIIDPASFAVEISVPQPIMAQVNLGQRVQFSSELFNGVREGKVIEMAHIATQNNQYGGSNETQPEFSVLANIQHHPSDNLLVGSEVEARFVLAEKPKAVFIPLEAILYRNDTPVVFLVRDGVALQQPVTTGLTNDLFIEIIDGLTPADTVVTTGNLDINHGDKIQNLENGTLDNRLQFTRRTPVFTP